MFLVVKVSKKSAYLGPVMLEICAFHLEDCFTAVHAGAQRLEVCTHYTEGGLTPPTEWIFALKHSVHVPLVAMVRPRGGDFHYSSEEWTTMKRQAEGLRQAGAHALVFGGLNQHSSLDIEANKALMKTVGLPAVLHRAFDEIPDPLQGVHDAIQAGFCRILTSWGQKDPETFKKIQKMAGMQIEILPGGGISSTNVARYVDMGCTQIHSSAITGPKQRVDQIEIQALLAQMSDK